MAACALFLAVVTAGPVAAQTTTTSSTSTTTTSTTTSSTTTSTSTTLGSTTTTTPVMASTDFDPPSAHLAGASGEVRGGLGSYCWAPPGGTAGRCVDRLTPSARPSLSVRADETLALRFTTGLPVTGITARVGGVELALPTTNPSQFKVALAPGTYNLDVLARFSAGSASYAFVLQVNARPATPVPAPNISLTG